MERKWLEVYERLVNTDTGFEVPIDEKLDSTSFLVDILKGMGFEVERGRASHIATIGDPPYIAIIGHLDTVFKRGEPERRPFKVVDGEVYGPGVADMKGGIVIALMLLESVIDLGVSIGVVFNVDEEIGSTQSEEDHVRMAKMSKFCMSFETGRGTRKVVTSRKGIANLNITSLGKSGHASMPESGVNAIVELSMKIPKIASLKVGNLTAVPTIVSGGFKSNVIPDRAEAFFDVRFTDEGELETFKTYVDEILTKPDVEGASNVYKIEIRRKPMKALMGAIEVLKESSEILGEDLESISVNGGGDASFYTENGVPALDGLGIVGRGIHGPDEVAFLDSVEKRSEIARAIFEAASRL